MKNALGNVNITRRIQLLRVLTTKRLILETSLKMHHPYSKQNPRLISSKYKMISFLVILNYESDPTGAVLYQAQIKLMLAGTYQSNQSMNIETKFESLKNRR